jgi:hypothetical protein
MPHTSQPKAQAVPTPLSRLDLSETASVFSPDKGSRRVMRATPACVSIRISVGGIHSSGCRRRRGRGRSPVVRDPSSPRPSRQICRHNNTERLRAFGGVEGTSRAKCSSAVLSSSRPPSQQTRQPTIRSASRASRKSRRNFVSIRIAVGDSIPRQGQESIPGGCLHRPARGSRRAQRGRMR